MFLYGLRGSSLVYVTQSNDILTANVCYIDSALPTGTNTTHIEFFTW